KHPPGEPPGRAPTAPEGECRRPGAPAGAPLRSTRAEAAGTRRLWQFTRGGAQRELVLRDVKPVGYHAWASERTLVLFVLGSPATLQIADTASGRADVLARDIGRSLQVVPGRGTVSFVAREPVAG